LILGDNIFHGAMNLKSIMQNFDNSNNQLNTPGVDAGARIFGYPVNDPERYGVVEFDQTGKVLSIEEKPLKPKSNYAVPGLYVYDRSILEKARILKPSARGELEITDINRMYLEEKSLYVEKLGRGIAWLDTGTHASLLDAANFIYTLEARQGLKIACLEEIAVEMGYYATQELFQHLQKMPKSTYTDYLKKRFKIEA